MISTFVCLFVQWFNLNSLQRRPELISDTYLKMFLTQLQLEGEEELEREGREGGEGKMQPPVVRGGELKKRGTES